MLVYDWQYLLDVMSIREWDGVALIIGTGDIGNHITDYLTNNAPKLDVVFCGRNLKSKGGI